MSDQKQNMNLLVIWFFMCGLLAGAVLTINIGVWIDRFMLQSIQKEAVELGYGEMFYLKNGRQAFRWLNEKEINQNDPSLSAR